MNFLVVETRNVLLPNQQELFWKPICSLHICFYSHSYHKMSSQIQERNNSFKVLLTILFEKKIPSQLLTNCHSFWSTLEFVYKSQMTARLPLARKHHNSFVWQSSMITSRTTLQKHYEVKIATSSRFTKKKKKTNHTQIPKNNKRTPGTLLDLWKFSTELLLHCWQ